MAAQEAPEHKLKLAELLDMLVADGMVGKAEADSLFNERHVRSARRPSAGDHCGKKLAVTASATAYPDA